MIAPVGVVLAGGRGSRLGGCDKGLLHLGGRTLLARVIARLEPQVAALALNAAGDPARFIAYGLPVIADQGADRQGPLAGVLAGLDWAAGIGATQIVTAPWDAPFLPCDLVPHLQMGAGVAGCAIAASGSGLQPVFGLWSVDSRAALRRALDAGQRKMTDWARDQGAVVVDFPDDAAFFNINTQADLDRAQGLS